MPIPAVLVLPYMASIVGKKKGNQTYYYVVTSGRVHGKPRITHQTYLGTAERAQLGLRLRPSRPVA